MASVPDPFLSGYARDVRGEVVRHESPHPDTNSALVAREADSAHHDIAWETAVVPETAQGPITFALIWGMSGMSIREPAAQWDLYVGETKVLTIDAIQRGGAGGVTGGVIPGTAATTARVGWRLFWSDRNGDPFGHLYVTVAPALYTPGRAVQMRIVGASVATSVAGSGGNAAPRDAWLMVFRAEARTRVSVRAEPALLRGTDGGAQQQIRFDIAHYGDQEPADISIAVTSDGVTSKSSDNAFALDDGYLTLRVPIQVVSNPATAAVTVRIANRVLFDGRVPVTPVTPVTIYLLHHSHLDIGYTHVQSEVAATQAKNLEQALALIDKSRDYPPDAQFKWNVEGFWALEAFLARATPEQRAQLQQAIRTRRVEVGPLYGNMLTGLAQPEELTRMTDEARRFARLAGVPLESAWISDVPGYTWGVVPALAHSGIKYFSLGTNTGDRIGHIIERLGDRPFYWRSASGQEKLLCWLHATGYSYFHTGLRYAARTNLLAEDRLFRYLGMVQTSDRPGYDLLPLRYNIGSDNGPPDDRLSDLVRAWNEKYVSPHLVVATMTEFFTAFERRYGATLPVYEGDLTPYWEDGAYSTARESIANQASSARLEQAETFWALRAWAGSGDSTPPRKERTLGTPAASGGTTAPATFPVDRFREAWRNVLLFNEHTWGSWNSMSAPDSEFAKAQWATKRAFAMEAERQSAALLDESVDATPAAALAPAAREARADAAVDPAARKEGADATADARARSAVVTSVDVFNSLSWPRTDLVTVPAAYRLAGDGVVDASGARVRSQRLSSGELVFLAGNVPALGAKRYRFVLPSGAGDLGPASEVSASGSRSVSASASALASGSASGSGSSSASASPGAGIDPASMGVQLDPSTGAIREVRGVPISGLLNRYVYQAGRLPAQEQTPSNVHITVAERGPLVTSVVSESRAPGTNLLRQEVRLISTLPRVEIIDTIDKRDVRDPEAVYFAFPFDIDNPQTRLGLVYGFYRPEAQQLPGSCKNYLTVRNWVDVSNAERGVTLVSPDALLVELGRMTTDANRVGWLEHVTDSATVFSYVMNNFWGTNYKASQEGVTTFRYALLPHGRFDAASAYKAGLEATHPLVVRPTAEPAAPTTRKALAPLRAPFILRNRGIIVSGLKPSEDGRGLIVTLFNANERTERPVLVWPQPGPRRPASRSRVPRVPQGPPAIRLVDRDERPTRRLATLPRMPAFGVLTVYVGDWRAGG